MLVLAAILVATAWPRLKAAWHFLPVDAAIARYYETGVVPVAQLDALAARAQAALATIDHYRYHEGLSFVAYLRALSSPAGSPARRDAMAASLASAREALRQAPAKPATWLRVARIEAASGATADRVVEPLALSMLTGRVEPTLLVPRLELGYRYVRQLDPEARTLLLDQTALAWNVRRRDILRSLESGQLDGDAVRQLLATHRRDLLADMEAFLDAAPG